MLSPTDTPLSKCTLNSDGVIVGLKDKHNQESEKLKKIGCEPQRSLSRSLDLRESESDKVYSP